VVAAVRTRPETFGEDLLRARRLVRASGHARPTDQGRGPLVTIAGGRVAGPGAVVSPWALEAVLGLVREHAGSLPVVFGDAPSGRAAERAGWRGVLERHGCVLDLPSEAPGVEVETIDLPWLRGRRGESVRVDERLPGRAACVVAPLRSCRRMGLRGAVDAAIAAVATERERHGSPVDAQAWTELLRLRLSLHPSTLFVLDATVCGSEEGLWPPVLFDVLVVGSDPVACDAVGARLLGLTPDRIDWLRSIASETRTPLHLERLDLRGESLDERDLPAGGTTIHARGGAGAYSRTNVLREALDPSRWTAPLRRRGWWSLYDRTPWGRLHAAYRAAGPSPVSTFRQE
jgi:hypothetical protein